MSKYKVGDKVRIIDCKSGHEFKIGDELTITEDDSFGSFRCNDSWWVQPEEIESINLPKKKFTKDEVIKIANEVMNLINDNAHSRFAGESSRPATEILEEYLNKIL